MCSDSAYVKTGFIKPSKTYRTPRAYIPKKKEKEGRNIFFSK